MKRLSLAIPVLIAIVALDFAVVFGAEAWRILASPVAGLERTVFADLVLGIGRLAGLSPVGIVNLAMTFGVVNLAIAAIFALHLASRLRALSGGRVAHDLLDAGLILAVISTIVAATPAILDGATDILVHQRLPLWLVGLAATLSMIERLPESEEARPGFCARLFARARGGSVCVSPAVRDRRAALRWSLLRSEAGLLAQPAPPRACGAWFSLR